jgi:membrane-bound lytic murein transglycosylase B
MRQPASRVIGDRARGVAVRRLLVSGVAASTVVLATVSTLAARSGAVAPLPGAVSYGVGVGVSATDRALQVPAISVGQARVAHDKGTPKLPRSAFDDLDIPAAALLAYQRAAVVIGQADASCGLSWTLLAAIGRVESDHGRYGGARLRPDGTSSPAIRGVALDGAGPVARIRDTDGAWLDGDPVWDRAVGPMQLLPSTWSVVGVDGDGDSVRSPDDIDDAALAAAVFLCGGPGDLTTRSGLRAAVRGYNPSSSYVASVLAVERSYRAGELDTPGLFALGGAIEILAVRSGSAVGATSGTAPGDGEHAVRAASGPRQHGNHALHGKDPTTPPGAGPGPGSVGTPASDPTGTPASDPTDTPDPGPTGTPDPGPTGTPDPTGTPEPGPTPAPQPDPASVQLTGVLTACASGWCLDELPLDVGGPDVLAAPAIADFDADGVVTSTNDELTGLAGTEVSVLVAAETAPALVLALNGVAYVPG